MSEAVVDDILAVLPTLLQGLEAMGFIARHLDPPRFDAVMRHVEAPDRDLQRVRSRLDGWPPAFASVQAALQAASDAVLAGFAGLRAVEAGQGDLVEVFRALRQLPRAQEALYPLAAKFPPVSEFFLEPEQRGDGALLQRLQLPPGEHGGIFHDANESGSRGGFSAYVPEYYSPDRDWPLVMALHGGSGNGRGFLWSWLREARGHGAIVVAPTAVGSTWALMGDDADTPNLQRILDRVRCRWRIDPARLLLTGMSDGGTFCYVSGLQAESPFTHLAPVAATFHPLMAEVADPQRMAGLPIRITHGRRDWMFPVQTARDAAQALTAAGAAVSLCEIDDLSHCYPREINPELLDWLGGESTG